MWPTQWICLLRSKYIALAYPKHQAIGLISLSSWGSQCLVYQSLDSLAPPKLPMREWAVYTPLNKLFFIMIRANSSACPKQSSPWLKQSYWPMLSWWFLIYFETLLESPSTRELKLAMSLVWPYSCMACKYVHLPLSPIIYLFFSYGKIRSDTWCSQKAIFDLGFLLWRLGSSLNWDKTIDGF